MLCVDLDGWDGGGMGRREVQEGGDIYIYIYIYMRVCMQSSFKSCLTLCDPNNCSLAGPSVHGILQARILEWVAMSFSRGSSQPRD